MSFFLTKKARKMSFGVFGIVFIIFFYYDAQALCCYVCLIANNHRVGVV